MAELVAHRRVLAVLLLAGALRSGCQALQPRPVDLLDPDAGPPTVLPDLAHDDRIRLSWLPGIGAGRAQQLVALRPHLGVPLTPERLALLPGFGPGIAAEVSSWYRRAGRSPPQPCAPGPGR